MKELEAFSRGDLKIITNRATQGAPDNVIATEIECTTGAIFSAAEIAKARDLLKLPPVDPARAVAAAVLRPEQALPVLEHESSRRVGAGPEFIKAAAAAKSKDPLIADLEAMLAIPRRTGPLEQPANVVEPQAGKIYCAPVYGVVLCAAIEETEAAGYKLRVAKLVREGSGKASSHNVPVSRFREKNIREPASPETLDNVLYALRHGGKIIRDVPSATPQRLKFFQEASGSASLETMAGLISMAFGQKKTAEGSRLLVDAANEAVRRLSEEYAHVKGVERKDAVKVIEAAVQKSSQQERDRAYLGQPSSFSGP